MPCVNYPSGFPASRSLTSAGGDLDNYLCPVARRLGAARFDAVFGSKRHAESSSIAVRPGDFKPNAIRT